MKKLFGHKHPKPKDSVLYPSHIFWNTKLPSWHYNVQPTNQPVNSIKKEIYQNVGEKTPILSGNWFILQSSKLFE